MKDTLYCCWKRRHSARGSSTFVEGRSVTFESQFLMRSVIVKVVLRITPT